MIAAALRASRPDDPLLALGVARILLGVVVLFTGELWWLADLVPPPGAPTDPPSGWLTPLLSALPRDALALLALQGVLFASAAAVTLGVVWRVAAPCLVLSLLLAVGMLQLSGTAVHLHHLVWLAALLGTTPATRRLALQRPREMNPLRDRDAEAARFWFTAAGVVLGCVYFFPGLHKLLDAASPFREADALARLLRLKAFEAGADVPLALDAHASLLAIGGAAVIGLELALLPLFTWPRTRGLAGALMVALHLALAFIVHIPFSALAVFALLGWVAPKAGPLLPRVRAPQTLVAVLVIGGVVVAGALGSMRGYPFAAYPTFATRIPTSLVTVELVVMRDEGERVLSRELWAPSGARTTELARARRLRTEAAALQLARRALHRVDGCETLERQADLVVRRVRVDLTTRPPRVESKGALATLPLRDACD